MSNRERKPGICIRTALLSMVLVISSPHAIAESTKNTASTKANDGKPSDLQSSIKTLYKATGYARTFFNSFPDPLAISMANRLPSMLEKKGISHEQAVEISKSNYNDVVGRIRETLPTTIKEDVEAAFVKVIGQALTPEEATYLVKVYQSEDTTQLFEFWQMSQTFADNRLLQQLQPYYDQLSTEAEGGAKAGAAPTPLALDTSKERKELIDRIISDQSIKTIANELSDTAKKGYLKSIESWKSKEHYSELFNKLPIADLYLRNLAILVNSNFEGPNLKAFSDIWNSSAYKKFNAELPKVATVASDSTIEKQDKILADLSQELIPKKQ